MKALLSKFELNPVDSEDFSLALNHCRQFRDSNFNKKQRKLRIHIITAKAALKFESGAWVLKKREE